MSSELLLRADPAAFMEAIEGNDVAKRHENLRTLDDVIACEVLRYGIYNDPTDPPRLAKLYNEIFMQASVDRRKEIYDHVKWIVPQLGGHTVGAFTPFMFVDTDIGIVSTATIDFASLGTPLDKDPIQRAVEVMGCVRKGIPNNRAAVLGGLIALGDPRVCELVEPALRDLTRREVGTVAKCHSGFTAKCVVHLYLDWIEELIDRTDYDSQGMLGSAIAGLHRLASQRVGPFVVDGLRPFPVPRGGGAWERQIDPVQFARTIADRLEELEHREQVPKVLPYAIRAFGLESKSDPADIEHLENMVQVDEWQLMSGKELAELLTSETEAMDAEWDEPVKALRHLMNCVLFSQLSALRHSIASGAFGRNGRQRILRSGFGLGYLSGLAANYVDAIGLPRESAEARAAIFDAHAFSFGESAREVLGQHSAGAASNSRGEFEEGLSAAHRDVNSYKRFLKGKENMPSMGLVDGLLSRSRALN
jgi:hypothetical protein